MSGETNGATAPTTTTKIDSVSISTVYLGKLYCTWGIGKTPVSVGGCREIHNVEKKNKTERMARN